RVAHPDVVELHGGAIGLPPRGCNQWEHQIGVHDSTSSLRRSRSQPPLSGLSSPRYRLVSGRCNNRSQAGRSAETVSGCAGGMTTTGSGLPLATAVVLSQSGRPPTRTI